MTAVDEKQIVIQILDRKYNIKCSNNEVIELQEAAKVVDESMRHLKKLGSVTTTEQMAVVSALNISHELLLLKKQKNNYINVMNQRLQDLQKKVEKFLAVDDGIAI